MRQQRSTGLLAYWRGGFPPRWSVAAVAHWYGSQTEALAQFFFSPLAPAWSAPLQAAALVGIVALLRRPFGGRILTVCLGPPAAATLAAGLHLYPYDGTLPWGGRVLLFALPGLLMLVAAGLGWVFRLVRRKRVSLIGALLVLAGITSSAETLAYGSGLINRSLPGSPLEETRGLVRTVLLPGLKPGDAVFIYYGAAAAFQFYAPQFRVARPVTPPMREFRSHHIDLVFGAYSWDLQRSVEEAHPRRLWMLLSHISASAELPLVRELGHLALHSREWRAPGATLMRADLPCRTVCASDGIFPHVLRRHRR